MSLLRLINPGEGPADVTIEGIDGKGRMAEEAVRLELPAGASRMLSAGELESGDAEGLTGALGTGSGKWQLAVSSEQAIEVMSLLLSARTEHGHMTNLSTVPDNAKPGEDGARTVHTVGLFPAASRLMRDGYQGFVRIINRSGESGEVRIDAIDDEGTEFGPVTLAIEANETKHFNSGDLETVNADKGLSGDIEPGVGDWRLRLSSSLDLVVLSYLRTEGGFLTSMHDVVPETEGGYRVAIFNPGGNENQVSRLRVINPGGEPAEVTVEGIDNKGESSAGTVTVSVPGGASRTLTARELESGEGEGLVGALGAVSGKWQLVVSSDGPLQVMSLLSSPSGHLTNLSTAPNSRVMPGETASGVFAEHISGPVVQSKCIACHVEGGVAGHTRLVFVPSSTPNHEAHNLQAFEDLLAEVEGGADYVLNKIQGVGHGGGVQVAAGTPEYGDMERFLRLLGEEVSSTPLTPQTLFDTVTMAPTRKTLRRAALIFAGRIPTDTEYAAAQGGADALRATIRSFMTGPEFHEFLIRGANDRLLTDRRNDFGRVIDDVRFVDYANEYYRRRKVVSEGGSEEEFWRWWNTVQYGFRRAPLELIAHVVENDLPYTEILTADYIMANPLAAAAYGASTRFDDPDDVHEFQPSNIVSYYRTGDGFEAEYDPVVEASRILNPGPLSTDYPHAGVLNTTVFLKRYPTTATNRNRARSRWTYYHFLGLDIEKSASRTTDPVALADTNNPTLHNPACTVCHRILDPVAGAFQNYGDVGLYRVEWGGLDSLDGLYKRDAGGPSLAIRAESWAERETLSWPVWMGAGVGKVRVVFANPFYVEGTGAQGFVHLDRMRVTDAQGQVLASREFEDLGPPVHPLSDHGHSCGATGRNPSGREDFILLWWGDLDCAIYMDVEVPSDGVYNVEIVAWSNGYIEQYGEDGFAKLSVVSNPYQVGDTWYRDMRAPGFAGEQAPNPDDSVQWLARKIVADERFAKATVEFWWPAIMGSEVAEPPEDEGDADFEGLLLAATAQGTEVARLARGFRRGFEGGRAYNLKDLLVEIVLSKWFRADAVEDPNSILHVVLRNAGARRLLTPEELARKTAALTGFQWGRGSSVDNTLSDEYRTLYGGIDSDGITERARDITSVMSGVAELHAAIASCAVVAREFYLLPDAKRRLFAGIDTMETGPDAIRKKLVDLYDSLLGVRVTPHSPDVEAAYRLFVDTRERGRRTRDA